jgi:dTDP-glucose 4,6-dehydratase
VRDWLFVGDLADGIERVVARGAGGEVYNFAGADERQNLDTVRLICSQLARLNPAAGIDESLITFVQDRPGHDFRYAMSIKKVESAFDWAPQTQFDGGLAATISWYLDNQDWCQAVLDRGYDGARIGTRTI